MLSNLIQSEINEHHMYVVTQEGHPCVIDRRQNHKVVRKMPGSKGSLRTASLLVEGGTEFLLTGGCDRYLRIYDSTKEVQGECCIGSAYMKQRINCILVAPESQ